MTRRRNDMNSTSKWLISVICPYHVHRDLVLLCRWRRPRKCLRLRLRFSPNRCCIYSLNQNANKRWKEWKNETKKLWRERKDSLRFSSRYLRKEQSAYRTLWSSLRNIFWRWRANKIFGNPVLRWRWIPESRWSTIKIKEKILNNYDHKIRAFDRCVTCQLRAIWGVS